MGEIRKYRFIFYIIVIIVIYSIPLSFIEARRFCIWYHLFEVDCFGCGFTRAFFNLMHGQILKAIHYNQMVIVVPLLFLVVLQDEMIIIRRSSHLSWLEFCFVKIGKALYPKLFNKD